MRSCVLLAYCRRRTVSGATALARTRVESASVRATATERSVSATKPISTTKTSKRSASSETSALSRYVLFCAMGGYSKLVICLFEERTLRRRVMDTASACVVFVSAPTLVSSVTSASATLSTATTTREDSATVRSHASKFK